jgi:hypothetical protein
MQRYDPEVAPAAEDWLALDEMERISLIEAYHREARSPLPKTARSVHASIHAAVENQLAEGHEPVVRALERLRTEALSRHDAVHALGSVLTEWVYELQKQSDTPDVARTRYYAAIERLTASTWRATSDD